uniref:ARAD1D33132p n=1 Tax=Blastobotrys adeninivorans TaxID=409370 RepID=A0A060TC45_BLAAD
MAGTNADRIRRAMEHRSSTNRLKSVQSMSFRPGGDTRDSVLSSGSYGSYSSTSSADHGGYQHAHSGSVSTTATSVQSTDLRRSGSLKNYHRVSTVTTTPSLNSNASTSSSDTYLCPASPVGASFPHRRPYGRSGRISPVDNTPAFVMPTQGLVTLDDTSADAKGHFPDFAFQAPQCTPSPEPSDDEQDRFCGDLRDRMFGKGGRSEEDLFVCMDDRVDTISGHRLSRRSQMFQPMSTRALNVGLDSEIHNALVSSAQPKQSKSLYSTNQAPVRQSVMWPSFNEPRTQQPSNLIPLQESVAATNSPMRPRKLSIGTRVKQLKQVARAIM